MIKNLFPIAYVVLGMYWAHWFHTRVFAAYGARRLARMAAYLGGALLVGVGMGLTIAGMFGGWHVLKGSGFETHTSVRDGVTFGIILGAIGGAGGFVKSEINGGQMLFELLMPDELWGVYTRRILAIESIASPVDRRRTAKFLVASATKTADELSPELNAYVERNKA